jgi:protein TonB
MLISKFDLYKTEWLELVFDDRNKTYGAYELRQHNSRTMLTAMLIAMSVVAVPLFIVGFVLKPAVAIKEPVIKVIPISNIVIEHPQTARPHQAHHDVAPPPSSAPHAVTHPIFVPVANVPPVVVPLSKPDDASSSTELGPISSGIDDGLKGGVDNGKGKDLTKTPGDAPSTPFTSVEQMPVPYGGAAAWAKFLRKNLQYPGMAIDQHIQGKVWVSFIVEKDGHLSNIVVDRGPGYGTNEEALRVLKLAPAWQPGIQNGQPVRVRYTVPINFQINDDNN